MNLVPEATPECSSGYYLRYLHILLVIPEHAYGRQPRLKMILLRFLISLLIVTNVDSFAFNRSLAASSLRAPSRSISDRLPNPYRVPSSPIALDFLDRSTGPTVPQREMTILLDAARQHVIARLESQGDGKIPAGTHWVESNGRVFVYESRLPDRFMMYSEVLSVIRGLNSKSRIDESKCRFATVLHLAPGGLWVDTGDAAVLESAEVDNA